MIKSFKIKFDPMTRAKISLKDLFNCKKKKKNFKSFKH